MKAGKLEIGVLRPETARKEEEGRSQKKCFYKYEMLPMPSASSIFYATYCVFEISDSPIDLVSRFRQNLFSTLRIFSSYLSLSK